jgi:uncharacterized MAPEG superfamily protein
MTREQKIVAIGSMSGVALMAASMALLYNVLPGPHAAADVMVRITYTLRANAFAAVPLFAAIIMVANARFTGPAIDPMMQNEDTAMIINSRVADNSLQQFVVFMIATLALATTLSPSQMPLIPAAVIVFILARIAFWIGYRIHPLYRAPGMGATAFLNLGLLGAALLRTINS